MGFPHYKQFDSVDCGPACLKMISAFYGKEHSQGRPYSQPVHRVELQGALKELLGRQTLQVNSLHHQAIKELAPELQTMALSEDDLIEAICLPSKKFVWAVQWHPEFLFRTDESSRTLFSTFVSACKSSV